MAPNYIIGSDVLLRKLPLIHSAPEQCFKLGCGWPSHILVLTLPWVFFSGFQNWILNHSARDILLVGYFPNCVAAPPSDSFARHKLTGRTWLRRPQVGRGRPTPTHRRCISKILWWPNMTLAVDQDCVKTNQYIGDQRSRWKPIDPNALSSSPIYDIVTWPVKVCVISNLLYLKPYWVAFYQNFHFKLWCFRKTLKFCNEGGASIISRLSLIKEDGDRDQVSSVN